MTDFRQGLKEYEEGLNRMQQAAERLGSLGATLTKNVTAPILGIGAAAVKLAVDSAKIDQVRQTFHDLAASVGQDADTILQKLREATHGMVSDSELMQQAVLAMLLIGRESLGDLSETLPRLAEIAAAASRATGESLSFMFESIVKGIGRASPMILDNLGFTIDLTAAYERYAKTLGATSGQVVDNSAKIAQLTTKLQDLKTQLHIAQLRMGELSEKTKESTRAALQFRIDKLNRQIAETEKELAKATAAHGKFASAVGEGTVKLTKEQKVAALLAEVMRRGEDYIKTFGKVQEDAAVLAGRLSAKLKNLKDTIGRALMPAVYEILKPLVEFGEKLGTVAERASQAFAKFAKGHPQLIQTAAAFAGLSATLGPGLVLLGKLMSVLGGLNPTILAFSAAVAVIGPLVAKHFGTISQVVSDVVGTVQPLIARLVSFVEDVAKAFSEGGLTEALAVWSRQWPELVGVARETLSELLRLVVDNLSHLGSTIVSSARDIVSGISDGVSEWPDAFLSWVGPVVSGIASALGDILDRISAWLADAAGEFDFSSWVESFLDWIEEVVPRLLSKLGELVASVAQALVSGTGEIEDSLGSWLDSFLSFAARVAVELVESLGVVLDRVVGWIAEGAPVILEELSAWGKAFVEWVGPNIGPMLSELGELAGELLAFVAEQAPRLAEEVLEWGKAFVEWVGPRIGPMLDAVGDLISSLLDKLAEAVPEIVAQLERWGKEFIEWVGPNIGPLVSELGELIGAVLSTLAEATPDIAAALLEWAAEFVRWVADVAPDLIVELGKLLAEVVEWILSEGVPTLAKNLVKWGIAFAQWVYEEAIPRIGPAMEDFLTALLEAVGEIAVAVGEAAMEIGKGIINGIKGGIESLWQDLQTWFSQQFAKLPDWVKKALQMFSPSVFFDIGLQIMLDLAEGISEGEAEVVEELGELFSEIGQAFSDIASGIRAVAGLPALTEIQELADAFVEAARYIVMKLLESAWAFEEAGLGWLGAEKWSARIGELMAKAVGWIDRGVDALVGLCDFVAPSEEAVDAFVSCVHSVIEKFVALGDEFDIEGLAAVQDFSEAAEKAMDLVSSAAEAFKDMSEGFRRPTERAVEELADSIRLVVRKLSESAGEFRLSVLAKCEDFVKAAEDAVDLIGDAAEAFGEMPSTFEVADDAVDRLVSLIKQVVREFTAAAEDFEDGSLEAAEAFLEAAEDSLDVMEAAFDAFEKMPGFVEPSISAVLRVTTLVATLVDHFVYLSGYFEREALAAAGDFLDVAEQAMDVLESAFEALSGIATLPDVSTVAMECFVSDVSYLVGLFTEAAQDFSTNALSQANVFLEAAEEAVGILADGAEGFEALKDYRGIPESALKAFFEDLEAAIQYLSEAAQQFSVEGMEHARKFAEAAGDVLDTIGDGVDALTDLRDYKGVPQSAFGRFKQDILAALGLMEEVRKTVGEDFVKEASKFASAANDVLDTIARGLEVLSSVRDYTGVGDKWIDLKDDVEAIRDFLGAAADLLEKGAADADRFKCASEAIVSDIVGGLQNLQSVSFMGVDWDTTELKSSLQELEDLGYMATSGFGEGINQGLDVVAEGVKNFINKVLYLESEVSAPMDRISRMGYDDVRDFGENVADGASDIADDLNVLINKVNFTTNSIGQSLHQMAQDGYRHVYNFGQNITDACPKVEEELNHLEQTVQAGVADVNAALDDLGETSPKYAFLWNLVDAFSQAASKLDIEMAEMKRRVAVGIGDINLQLAGLGLGRVVAPIVQPAGVGRVSQYINVQLGVGPNWVREEADVEAIKDSVVQSLRAELGEMLELRVRYG